MQYFPVLNQGGNTLSQEKFRLINAYNYNNEALFNRY